MERRDFIFRLGTGAAAGSVVVPMMTSSSCSSNQPLDQGFLKKGEIQHMVIFNLKYDKESVETNKFLADGERILSKIPGVQYFQVFKQVSVKNDYDYGFSMIFASKDAYTTYSNHSEHISFVEDRWKKEVTRFLEIDFEV
jgi:heme-degrading monooxygenase HmoA